MTDIPFFFNKDDARNRRAPQLPRVEAERIVMEYIDENRNPAIIRAGGVDKMLRRLQSIDPTMSENDLELALKACGYVLNDISTEIGDYKRTRT
jgi:hypothetical protein